MKMEAKMEKQPDGVVPPPLNLSGAYSPKLASYLVVLDTPQLAAG